MQSLVKDAVTILLAVNESPGPFGRGGQAIASHLYLLVTDGDIHRFNTAKGLLVEKGWVTATAEIVTITEAGRGKAAEIEKMLEAAQ